jgi:hypothetical protein
MTAGVVGISVLAAGDAANFYSGMLPSLFTIRSDFFDGQGHRTGNVKGIRVGEVAATAMSLTVAVGASLVVNNWLPVVVTGATCAVLVAFYEWALRNPAKQDG